MMPSLAYIDFSTGSLMEKVSLPEELHQLSIRHIDVNQDDQVVIAMQYQGDKTDQVALMAVHKRGTQIKLLSAPTSTYLAMKHYCGSVCFDDSGKYAAATSPKGDRITIWDITKLIIVDERRCRDACGVAALGKKGFVISSGAGKLYHYNIEQKEIKRVSRQLSLNPVEIAANTASHSQGMAWDNHLSISS